MDLQDYINTTNYRRRIKSMLRDEKNRLTPKQFSQFAVPLEQELDRLEGAIAEYEMGWSTVTCTVCCSSYDRLMHPHVTAFTGLWLKGGWATQKDGLPQYSLSERLLYQDNWERCSGLRNLVACADHLPQPVSSTSPAY